MFTDYLVGGIVGIGPFLGRRIAGHAVMRRGFPPGPTYLIVYRCVTQYTLSSVPGLEYDVRATVSLDPSVVLIAPSSSLSVVVTVVY